MLGSPNRSAPLAQLGIAHWAEGYISTLAEGGLEAIGGVLYIRLMMVCISRPRPTPRQRNRTGTLYSRRRRTINN